VERERRAQALIGNGRVKSYLAIFVLFCSKIGLDVINYFCNWGEYVRE
jgi:hypothetical protein